MASSRVTLDPLPPTAPTTITTAALPANGVYNAYGVQTNTNRRPAALLWVNATITGAAVGSILEFYLLRHNDAATPIGDDSWAGVAATLTLQASSMLGTIPAIAATGTLRRTIDTRTLGPLGNSWGIGLRNSLGVGSAITTLGLTYRYYFTETV
jgi:hypothetical protein